MGELKTVKVLDGHGGHLVINEKDFIKGKHALWTEAGAAAEKKAKADAEKKAADDAAKAAAAAEKGGKG